MTSPITLRVESPNARCDASIPLRAAAEVPAELADAATAAKKEPLE